MRMIECFKTCAHKILCKTNCFLSALNPLVNLGVRLYIANIFFKSGLVKIGGWNATLYLFQYEYKVPVISYALAAVLATFVELVGSTALAVGFATRYAAMALLTMTAVINYTYAETPENYYWMLILAMLVTQGGRRISVDYLLKRKFCDGHYVGPCCDKTCSHMGMCSKDQVKNLTTMVSKPHKKSTTSKKVAAKKK